MRIDDLTNWTDLTEALDRSLSRVQTHMQTRSVGLISANLASNTAQENLHARHELTQMLRQAGFGYSHVRGMARERDQVVSEPSLLVIGDKGDDPALKHWLIRAGQKFDQSDVIYKSGSEDDAMMIHTRNDEDGDVGAEFNIGPWHANRTAAQFFTKLKAGQFDFGHELQEMRIVYTRPISFSNREESLF